MENWGFHTKLEEEPLLQEVGREKPTEIKRMKMEETKRLD